MPVAANALFIADGLGDGLSQSDADVFGRVMGVDMQIALGLNVQINQAVPGDLIQHVFEKRNTGIETGSADAVEIDRGLDPGFQGVAADGCATLGHGEIPGKDNG